MLYFLLVLITPNAGEPAVEVRIPFQSHEACVAEAARLTKKIKTVTRLFVGGEVDDRGCFKS